MNPFDNEHPWVGRFRRVAVVGLMAALGAMLLSTPRAEAGEAPERQTASSGLLVQDAALRGAPREASPAQAQLARGEALELRAERGDHWQVWDYRRERGGWLRKAQVMVLPRGEGATAQLLAQLRLARQQWGTEGLVLGLASAYVQAATPAEMASAAGAEVLDAMGGAAERMAERASQPLATGNKAADTALAAQMEVASRYGLHFVQFEAEDGRVQVCYDGEVFRRLLGLPTASPEQRLHAALSLTRPDCVPARATPDKLQAHDHWRAEVLARVEPAALPTHQRNRWLLRQASVAASQAFAQARLGRGGDAGQERASSALADFARVVPSELTEDDLAAYNEAALRVNASRWLAQAATATAPVTTWGGLSLSTRPAPDGQQNCVELRDAHKTLLAQRCSFGLVAPASASLNREANALALAVQVLEGWRELWVFVKTAEAWRVEVLPPAAASPGLGVAEFAGWVPGGKQMLVARESKAEGRYRRSFELVSLATLQPERQAAEPRALGAFQRWADPGWVRASPATR